MIKSIVAINMLAILTTSLFCHKNIVLISAPGSGKGTLSQYLKTKYTQICPGDIFRSEINAQTQLGKQIQPIVESGKYVDENIVCQLIENKLNECLKTNKPFILDGFPRSDISFQFLYNFFQRNNLLDKVCFLQLIASDATCVKRMIQRLVCLQCCNVYNAESAKPQKTNVCNDCNIQLVARKADTQEIAEQRIGYFHKHVEPLLHNKLITFKKIETECLLQELYQKYNQLLEENA